MSCYESQDVTGCAGRVTKQAEMLHDTREKLEEGVREFSYQDPNFHTTEYMMTHAPMDIVLGWLDRQAAITERETLHSHPMCAGSDACPASNRPIGESADRETPDTAGIGASKDEIRDFDVWNVAYEIYCAGGYVDNGNEPNPPTDGIRELLDRQAAITERETKLRELYRFEENHREHVRSIEAVNQELNAKLADARESLEAAWEDNAELGDQVDELKAKLDAEAQHAREAWRLWGEADVKLERMTAERDHWKDAFEDSERMRLELIEQVEY